LKKSLGYSSFAHANTKDIHLVTYNLGHRTFEVSSLELWIKADINLFLKGESEPNDQWIILSAHESAEEALIESERMEKR